MKWHKCKLPLHKTEGNSNDLFYFAWPLCQQALGLNPGSEVAAMISVGLGVNSEAYWCEQVCLEKLRKKKQWQGTRLETYTEIGLDSDILQGQAKKSRLAPEGISCSTAK